jgi:hypothetical protein
MPYGPIPYICYICCYFQFPKPLHHPSLFCVPIHGHVVLIFIFLKDPAGDCASVAKRNVFYFLE